MVALNKYASKKANHSVNPKPVPHIVSVRKKVANFFFKTIPGRFPWRSASSQRDTIRAYCKYELVVK